MFYRRINKNQLKAEWRINWNAFKPRQGEDGIENGPSVYLADRRSALEALQDHCESDGRHLVAFRDCVVEPPLALEQRDPEDDSHFFLLNYPADEDVVFEWAKRLANASRIKILCVGKQIRQIYGDPPVSCPEPAGVQDD